MPPSIGTTARTLSLRMRFVLLPSSFVSQSPPPHSPASYARSQPFLKCIALLSPALTVRPGIPSWCVNRGGYDGTGGKSSFPLGLGRGVILTPSPSFVTCHSLWE